MAVEQSVWLMAICVCLLSLTYVLLLYCLQNTHLCCLYFRSSPYNFVTSLIIFQATCVQQLQLFLKDEMLSLLYSSLLSILFFILLFHLQLLWFFHMLMHLGRNLFAFLTEFWIVAFLLNFINSDCRVLIIMQVWWFYKTLLSKQAFKGSITSAIASF